MDERRRADGARASPRRHAGRPWLAAVRCLPPPRAAWPWTCSPVWRRPPRGIVHRDVKPANVFFDGAGNAKLGDFGAAHLLDFGHTQTGSFVGTLAYLSPEQNQRRRHRLRRGHLRVGRDALRGPHRPATFPGARHRGPAPVRERPLPSALRPALTLEHDHVLLRALAKAPVDRFASADAMAEAIAGWPIEVRWAPTAAAPQSTTNTRLRARAPAPGRARAPPPPTTSARCGSPTEAACHCAATRAPRARSWSRCVTNRWATQRWTPCAGSRRSADRSCSVCCGCPKDNRRTIWYEALPGAPLPLATLTPAERAGLTAALAALPPGAARSYARTTTGPVLLVAPGPARP